MTRRDRAARIDDLLDKREIEEAILRYCRGVDRMDRELVRSCYHDDAVDEHGSFAGTADEFVEWVFRILPRYEFSMHFVGNVLIELGEPRAGGNRAARAETYGISHHRTPDQRPQDSLITGFRYIDRFERRDTGPWKIARRVCTTEWSRIDEAASWWPTPPDLRTGLRNRSDPVYDPID